MMIPVIHVLNPPPQGLPERERIDVAPVLDHYNMLVSRILKNQSLPPERDAWSSHATNTSGRGGSSANTGNNGFNFHNHAWLERKASTSESLAMMEAFAVARPQVRVVLHRKFFLKYIASLGAT